jgi:hypothetical protein
MSWRAIANDLAEGLVVAHFHRRDHVSVVTAKGSKTGRPDPTTDLRAISKQKKRSPCCDLRRLLPSYVLYIIKPIISMAYIKDKRVRR